MYVLGVDVETTGFSPPNGDIITEVGAVLWHVESRRPHAMLSELVALEEGDKREIPPDITRLTGITTDMLRQPLARPLPEVLSRLFELAALADFWVAHNAPFDREFIEAAASYCFFDMPQKPWIDTSTDVPYADRITTRKLTYLCAEHGFANPFAHRALFDVLSMLNVSMRYPFEAIRLLQASPTVRLIGRQPREQNDEAREVGFRWDSDTKQWTRNVKACQVQLIQSQIKIPFVVETL